LPTAIGDRRLECLRKERRHVCDTQLGARLPHAVVEHHGAERARDSDRLSARCCGFARAFLVDLRAALLHPHVRAARTAAERALAAARHLERPPDPADGLARRGENVVVAREVAGVVVRDRVAARDRREATVADSSARSS
jgi:hypothetical protein